MTYRYSLSRLVHRFLSRKPRRVGHAYQIAAVAARSTPLLWGSVLAFLFSGIMLATPVQASSRIKDIVDFEGIRQNLLIGYGLVVGLNGTGDSLTNSAFTKESLIGMLERLGINTRAETLKTANVAAVMVTATLPSFSRHGTRIDVSVAALGDATSLLGGTLLVTPLVGADSEVYAVAQGQIAIGGFTAKGNASSVTKGVPTSGRIASGAIVERELKFQLASLSNVRISLRNPDLTTARRISQSINKFLGKRVALPADPGTVNLAVPGAYPGGVVALLTDIEQLRVDPDQIARVVVDEKSGIIVMGENVRINTVAIAQGNLTIRVTESEQVSQPNAFSSTGSTEKVDRSKVDIDEDGKKKLALLPKGCKPAGTCQRTECSRRRAA